MNIQQFDFSVNLLRALLWQYNDAVNLQALLQRKQDWVNEAQTGFWTDWYSDVFDLRTANDFGLSVWAIILGIPLAVAATDDPNKPIFGFASDDSNFGNSNFAASGGPVVLSTAQKRIALRLRYYQLTTRGTVPEANAIVKELLGGGYVVDGYNMRARYVLTTPPSSQLEFVLRAYDLLPRPAGVLVDFVVAGEADGWGFGAYHENFSNGNFYHA